MKKSILLAYIALLIAFGLPVLTLERGGAYEEAAPQSTAAPSPLPSPEPAPEPAQAVSAAAAPQTLQLVAAGNSVELDMQSYLYGVVAAEMPASFHPQALKAQAVAARSYAIYTMQGGKHGEGRLCGDYACCQAWYSEDELRRRWGEAFEENMAKIRAAVDETEGEYLCYGGQAVFAAFHSSSPGRTENSGSLWAQLPYLVSVESPETGEDVPGYVSCVACAPLDFRDTLLRARPEADFTGEEGTWIGAISRDESGRVESAVLGGLSFEGTELRSLFALRSTAFSLEYTGGQFVFTVTGYGHGVGMSQYGANVMAAQGADYREILAHYYPGTELTGA